MIVGLLFSYLFKAPSFWPDLHSVVVNLFSFFQFLACFVHLYYQQLTSDESDIGDDDADDRALAEKKEQ